MSFFKAEKYKIRFDFLSQRPAWRLTVKSRFRTKIDLTTEALIDAQRRENVIG
ncbi:MAG: hypothetical protein ACE5EH_11270 [Gammaproteobacteria bacterium]